MDRVRTIQLEIEIGVVKVRVAGDARYGTIALGCAVVICYLIARPMVPLLR